MSIVSTPIGTHSIQFDYSSGTTLAEISAGLDTEILNGHGWEHHDVEAGVHQICYKALNIDGVSYKYVVVDLSKLNVVCLKVYQNWDATAHTGTNLCFNSDVDIYGGKIFDTSPGQLYLYINPRWLALTTRNPLNGALNFSNVHQGIFGCFEFSRDNLEDTDAALPNFLWLNTSMLFYGETCGYAPVLFNTAIDSAASVEVSTIMGKTKGSTIKLGNFTPTTKNPWNSKDWSFTLYVHEPDFCVRGRIYGLKVSTYNAYLFLDRIIAKCDSNYLYSSSGTDTEHHIVHSSISSTPAQQNGRVIIPV